MWGTPLTIVMLMALLAVIAWIALWAGRLDIRLGAVLQELGDERRRVAREAERVRATGAPGC